LLPLSDVRVVALEHAVAAPLCSRHLADLGADVVKVERAAGDFARGYDSVARGQSAYFVWLNRGKRSVALELRRPDDRAMLDALLARADVFVHNLGPGAVDRLGLGWSAVHSRWPRLISCGISGYGTTGPLRERKAYDLLLQAESGLLAVTGTPDEMAKVGVSIADIASAMYALTSILAALALRERTGEGTTVDVAMLDCLAEWMSVPAYYQIHAGAPPARTGTRHSTIVPYGQYRTGDGRSVCLAVQNDPQWRRLCEVVLRRPELVADARFLTNELRLRNRDILEPLIEAALGADTVSSATARLEAADVPFGAVNDVAGLVAHAQLAARGRWVEDDSPGGPVRVLREPFDLDAAPRARRRVPALGEHTDELRRELGLA